MLGAYPAPLLWGAGFRRTRCGCSLVSPGNLAGEGGRLDAPASMSWRGPLTRRARAVAAGSADLLRHA